MANIKNYEDYIRRLDDECQQSIVCIRIYSDKNKDQLSNVGTGIVVASEDHSCFIMTSADFIKNLGGRQKVGFVKFFDGTIYPIDWNRSNTYKEIVIFHIPSHCKSVEFGNEVVEGQKVFTIGYNFNIPDKRFISGNIVCGANKEGTQFVHGSSTGKHGHQGSAVFNEKEQLVGMNVFYTRSTNINYSKNNESAIGGLVSALDLHIISQRLRYMCFKDEAKDKSLDQALERLKAILRQGQSQSQ